MTNSLVTRLSSAFTAHDIMTPVQHLKRADSYESARHLLHEYDVVPHPKEGKIDGFYRRGSEEQHPLTIDLILSDRTPLTDLPRLLGRSTFYFLLSADQITGYVHFSDLNKADAKTAVFALFQAVERSTWERIGDRIAEEDLPLAFASAKKEVIEGFINKKRRARENNVDAQPWAGVFNFDHILRLARYRGLIALDDNEIKMLGEMRNRTAHSSRTLLESAADSSLLASACELCTSVIGR